MLTISKLQPGLEYWSGSPHGGGVVGRWVVQPWDPTVKPKWGDVITFQDDLVTSAYDAEFVSPVGATDSLRPTKIRLAGYADWKLSDLLYRLNHGHYIFPTKGKAVTLWRFFPEKKKREYKPSIFAEPLPLP